MDYLGIIQHKLIGTIHNHIDSTRQEQSFRLYQSLHHHIHLIPLLTICNCSSTVPSILSSLWMISYYPIDPMNPNRALLVYQSMLNEDQSGYYGYKQWIDSNASPYDMGILNISWWICPI